VTGNFFTRYLVHVDALSKSHTMSFSMTMRSSRYDERDRADVGRLLARYGRSDSEFWIVDFDAQK
jgi:hypothetical protein